MKHFYNSKKITCQTEGLPISKPSCLLMDLEACFDPFLEPFLFSTSPFFKILYKLNSPCVEQLVVRLANGKLSLELASNLVYCHWLAQCACACVVHARVERTGELTQSCEAHADYWNHIYVSNTVSVCIFSHLQQMWYILLITSCLPPPQLDINKVETAGPLEQL